ncbi:MAG: glycosyltransferase family 1 protein [Lachnospiraceae bacterium]|nr:glycosyltransferase family 1 protein [Lachnospiraceae bacterium]
MKILLLKGVSQYGAMRNYIDHWNYILQEKGYETYIIDISAGVNVEQLSHFITSQRPNLVLACNAICGKIAENAVAGFGKYVTVLYDNPVIHTGHLKELGENSAVFSCDAIYADYIREHYPAIGYVGFLPLSGDAAKQLIPYEQRNCDLLFTGSYFNVNKAYETLCELPVDLRGIAMQVAQEMIDHPSLVLWESLDKVLAAFDINLSMKQKEVLLDTFRCIDIFVRAYIRDKVMHSIVGSQIPIHIFGNGWEEFSCKHPENLILHEGYGEVAMTVLADTKLSLNIMPWFRAGIQERNIAAMLAGTVSVTDSSLYIEENFTDGEDIVLYSLERLEELPGIITGCLEDTERSREIAERGYEKAVNGHTWKHRIEQLLSELNLV